MFPFTAEALAPLFMFMSQLPATHLIFAHHSLGVVYQDSSKSSYIFSMFKTKNPKSGILNFNFIYKGFLWGVLIIDINNGKNRIYCNVVLRN